MTLCEELLEIIRKQSYEKRDVTLSSGRKSDFYIDGKMTTTDPRGAFLVGKLIFDLIKPLAVEGAGGLAMGADPIATSIAIISHMEGSPVQAFFVRKEAKKHGKRASIEGGYGLTKGSKVVILEDVVTTGGSSLDAIQKVQEAEFDIVKVIALVDREEGGREAIESAGFEFEPLFTRSDVLGD